MNLTIGQRIALINVIPDKIPAYLDSVIHNLRMELGFTETEIQVIGFHYIEKELVWDNELPQPDTLLHRELENFLIGEAASEFLVSELEKMGNKLVGDYLSVYNLLK